MSKLIYLTLLSVAIGYAHGACSNLVIDNGNDWIYIVYTKPQTFLFEDWGNGFTADLTVVSDHDATGFTLVLTWDQALDSFEQWTGDASSSDQKYEPMIEFLKNL